MHLLHGRAFTAVLTLFTSWFSCLFAVEYNLCSCSTHPNHHPFLEADSYLLWPPSPDPRSVCSGKTGPCAPPGGHKPSLGPWLLGLSWASTQVLQDLVQPALRSSAGPNTHPSHPTIPMKVCSMNRSIIREFCGHKDLPGHPEQRHLCHTLFTWMPAVNLPQTNAPSSHTDVFGAWWTAYFGWTLSIPEEWIGPFRAYLHRHKNCI